MSNYHEIAKLTGAENYSTWEVSLRAEMILADIFDLLEDDYVAPTDVMKSDPAEGSSAGKKLETDESTAEAEALARTEYKKHVSANKKALAAIHMTVKTYIYAQIKLITDARKAWKKLKELYGGYTEAMFEKAVYRLLHLDVKDYKDLPAYLSEFKECTAKLEEMGSPLPHKLQVAYYKMGLSQYLQDRMFTLSQYDVRNGREVNLDFITTELGTRILADRPLERADETTARRGLSRNRRKGPGPQGSRGTTPSTSRTRSYDRNDHKHNGEPCKYGKECFKKYPEKKPNWWK